MKIQEKIGDKIRTVRESKNYTQAEVAEKIGISTNGYAKIEHGKTQANLKRLQKIAEALEIDLLELLVFGEKQVYVITDNSNNGSNIIGSSQELAAEVQKLKLILTHKDEIIEKQKKEIAHLEEINELLRKS